MDETIEVCSNSYVDATDALGDSESPRSLWYLCGSECPKAEVVFLCQVVVLYTFIVVSIYNLTRGHGDSSMWTALLSISLGYLLLHVHPSSRRGPL